jgi:aarF domain-containing kinase
MRLADVLIDLAAVLNASRSVASKHVALRGRQLDYYAKTSSIATALRQQRRPDPGSENRGPVNTHPTETASPGDGEPVSQEPPSPFPAGDGPSSESLSGLAPRSAQDAPPAAGVLPQQPSPQQPPRPRGRVRAQGPSSSGKSEFVPAPWESLASSATIHKTSPVTPLVDLDSKTGVSPAEKDDDVPPGVDISALFRTSRGSKILESLKEPAGESDKDFSTAESTKSASSGTIVDVTLPAQPGPDPVPQPDTPGLQPKANAPAQDASQDDAAAAKVDFKTVEKPSVADPKPPAVAETEPSDGVRAQEDPRDDPVKAQAQLSKEDASLVEELTAAAPAAPSYQLRESKVPATRISRLWNYGGLAAGMFAGAIGEGLSRAVGGGGQGSMMLSAGNMERLVAKLSRMRGAALKLGQMMSFQDSKMLPAPIQEVLQRVQDRADYMPAWQRDKVLVGNLGPDWRELFDEFEEMPIAAASIGQVHRATLKSNGAKVAVKIQFPGVADSINSDLDNIGVLLAATRLLPKGLYLNKTIDNARTELGWECDYEREAVCGERYRSLLTDETDVFVVPKIYLEASGKQVLTMEFMEGIGVTRVTSFNQEQRDWIGTQILRLCLREITEFKFMQTDPNWTNFLYNAEKNKLELLDFGASREYPDKFITLYVRLLEAASRLDKAAVKTLSEELGYLTGHESKAMFDAHITSVLTLAEPFLDSAPEVYDFRDQTITERVKDQIPVMIHERLAPPPEETYSLHRKLSGAFLLCARLGSRVRCRDLFEQAIKKTDLVR